MYNIFNFFRKEEKEVEQQIVNTIIIQEQSRGTSGTSISSGYYDEEYLYNLKGKDAAIVFDKMRRSDAQIKMLLSAVKNPIRTAPKDIVISSDDTEFKNHAEFCKKVLFKDINFSKFITEALTMCEFGHSVFEKVHHVKINSPILNIDGETIIESYIGLKKLGWRSPKTLEQWIFCEESKELTGLRQQVDGDLQTDVIIPVEHLVVMTLEMEGSDYEGLSMLRPCYGNWFRKNNYLKLNAMGIEKSMPTPTAEVPVGKENSQQYTNLVEMLEKFTTHQKNYITFPAGWNVNLSSGTAYDPSKVETSIDKEDIRSAKAFLANFLELGLSGTGAFALSNDLSDFFLGGLLYISGILKEEIDKICKELVILNFGEQEIYPEIEFIGIKDKAGKELAEIIKMLVDGKVIIPDDNLERQVRNRYELPEKSDDGQRDISAAQAPMTFSEKIKRAIANN